jgi:hypothetical protein
MWRSQQPRPAGEVLTQSFCTLADDNDTSIFCARLPLDNGKNYLGQEYGGRVTVLATAIGEESFPDKNGNGRFDESEYTLFLGLNVSDEPYDLKEAFVDHNEDRFYNPEESNTITEAGGELEEFADFNRNGVFDLADGVYNGVLCGLNDESDPGTDVVNQYCANPDDEPDPTKKSEKVSTNVRNSVVIVMSGNQPYITLTATIDAIDETIPNPDFVEGGTEPETIPNPSFFTNTNSQDTNLYITGENTGAVSVIIADLHNQPMPAGTIVSFSAIGAGSIVGTSSFTWPSESSNGGSSFSVAVKGESEPAGGSVEITVTTPLGVSTVLQPVGIIIE